MADFGLYALTKAALGALSAVGTGPAGGIDLPPANPAGIVAETPGGYIARLSTAEGAEAGVAVSGDATGIEMRDLPEVFLAAVLAAEDARFLDHPGLDPAATLSAAIDTLKGNLRGGSTLTQQMVKNAVTGSARTLDRKVVEAILASRVQASSPRSDIFETYLETAWFGRGPKGAGHAARAWFGKSWSEVTAAEAALLAGFLRGPAHYDPVSHPDRAKARRDMILSRMADLGAIPAEERDAAIATPLEIVPGGELDASERIPWIGSAVRAEISRDPVLSRVAAREGVLDISTSMDPDWQRLSQDALRAGLSRIGAPEPAGRIDADRLSDLAGALSDGDMEGGMATELRDILAPMLGTGQRSGRAVILEVSAGNGRIAVDRGFGAISAATVSADRLPEGAAPGDVYAYRRDAEGDISVEAAPPVQGAAIVMEAETGRILASVGGGDPDTSAFNRAYAARQPGSAIKPLLYATALDMGMSYDSPVEDRIRSYNVNGTTWTPGNYDGTQSGRIPLFVALEESSNIVAVRLAAEIGLSTFIDTLEIANVYPDGETPRSPTIALGAGDTTLTDLAAGYAAIANGGTSVEPRLVDFATANGVPVFDGVSNETRTVASWDSMALVSSMLHGVTVRGTAAGAFSGSGPLKIAGKTGTSQDYRDAWFMGFTPDLVVGVWVGRDDNTPIPGRLTGSQAAAPMVRAIFEEAAAAGLVTERGVFEDGAYPDWPPSLLEYTPPANTRTASGSGSRTVTSERSVTQTRRSSGGYYETQSSRPGTGRRITDGVRIENTRRVQGGYYAGSDRNGDLR